MAEIILNQGSSPESREINLYAPARAVAEALSAHKVGYDNVEQVLKLVKRYLRVTIEGQPRIDCENEI